MLGKIHEFIVQIRHRINIFPIQFSYFHILLQLNLLSKKSKTIFFIAFFLTKLFFSIIFYNKSDIFL